MGVRNRILKPLFTKIMLGNRAKIAKGVSLGRTSIFRISDEASLMLAKNVVFRERVTCNVSASGCINIGEGSFLNDGCCLNARECIDIGRNVLFGQNVLVYDHDHDYKQGSMGKIDSFSTSPVLIKDKVWIGSDVVILKGVTIGENSVVAAGCIVSKDVPPNTLIYNKRIIVEKDISEFKDAFYKAN